jgi:hypothetical protein
MLCTCVSHRRIIEIKKLYHITSKRLFVVQSVIAQPHVLFEASAFIHNSSTGFISALKSY